MIASVRRGIALSELPVPQRRRSRAELRDAAIEALVEWDEVRQRLNATRRKRSALVCDETGLTMRRSRHDDEDLTPCGACGNCLYRDELNKNIYHERKRLSRLRQNMQRAAGRIRP